MSIHLVGTIGLVVVFVIGTSRPINLGALALVMTFLVGTFAGESVTEMYKGFPVDLFVLLAGVTYLFAIASGNGTVERIVEGAASLVKERRALIPWIAFVVTSLPAMAGALGSAGVAMLAPITLRLAERYDIDRRMIGLMVVHGAAAGNFSPLNVLALIVKQSVERNGLSISSAALFLANLAYNIALAVIIYLVFGGLRLSRRELAPAIESNEQRTRRLRVDQTFTLLALAGVALAALVFGLNIGFLAFTAAVLLHLAFPKTSAGAEGRIAWSVVLLVCGVVTYVAALQRYGTVQVVGDGIANLGSPLVGGLLICLVAAVTSAFASSAGILAAMIPLAVPVILQGGLSTAGVIIALAISATVVDGMPFSTVGALVVANAQDAERPRVYRGLLYWGAAMVATAPLLTWLIFIVTA